MVDSTYRQVIQEIEARGIMPESAPSLQPIQEALSRIIPRDQYRPNQTVVVAGTNGKGSVCAILEALLLSAGATVGTYISPHLVETTERIRVNGKEISKELFCHTYFQISEKLKDLSLTHFEILTAMAAWVFFASQEIPRVEYSIFEVGMGGTWDATNAIPHHHCVITSLGYDHLNILGKTLEEIASNKFGIIQKHAKVTYTPFPVESRESLMHLSQQIQNQTQSQWTQAAPFQLEVLSNSSQPQFILHTQWGSAPLSLAGHRGAQNAATALTTFASLGFHPEDHLSVLGQVNWPGRMERISSIRSCPAYFSGDHNAQGIQSLVDLLHYYPRNHLWILIGVGKDKDLDGILEPLFALRNSSLFLTETPFRGRKISEYGHWARLAQDSSEDPLALLKKVEALAQPQDMILITGSLYLVGQLKSQLRC